MEKYIQTNQMEFETAYENTYGTIEEVPVFVLTAAKVLPIFILVFMLLNITNFKAHELLRTRNIYIRNRNIWRNKVQGREAADWESKE